MKKFQTVIVILSVFYCLTACSGGGEGKKVLVMASGKVQVNENVVTLEPGTTHTEMEIPVTTDKLTVNSPAGSTDFKVADAGLYLLNIKNDTLVGSYQRIGTDNSQTVISQENLKTRIDSLNKLMAGTNTSS